MQNIMLEIEYDGTDFFGWETQKKERTIRNVIETYLSILFQEKIKLVCAARTDAGVHAISQIANFKTTKYIPPLKFKKALLKLPPDIYVKNVSFVATGFDARYDAISRTYIYKIICGKSPVFRLRAWEYTFSLDIDRIKNALNLFIGSHSFEHFACKDSGICEVKNFSLIEQNIHSEHPCLIFEISANRFLRHMVRLIIGTLTELGRGKITEENIKSALYGRGYHARTINSITRVCAPPHGLYLKHIEYPCVLI